MKKFNLIVLSIILFNISANAQGTNWNLTSLSKNEICRPIITPGIAGGFSADKDFPKTYSYISNILIKKGFKYADDRKGCKKYSISFQIDTGRTRQVAARKNSESSYVHGSIAVNLFGDKLIVSDVSKRYDVYYVNLYKNQITRMVNPYESEDEVLLLVMEDLISIFMQNWIEDHK